MGLSRLALNTHNRFPAIADRSTYRGAGFVTAIDMTDAQSIISRSTARSQSTFGPTKLAQLREQYKTAHASIDAVDNNNSSVTNLNQLPQPERSNMEEKVASERSYRAAPPHEVINANGPPSVRNLPSKPAKKTTSVGTNKNNSLPNQAIENTSTTPKVSQSKEVVQPAIAKMACGTIVNIIYVCNESSIYVIDMQKRADYEDLNKEVAVYARRSQPVTSLTAHAVYAAPKSDGVYARAMYVRHAGDGENVIVGFVDHGYTDTVAVTRLRSLSDQLCARERFARKITLADLPEKDNRDDFISFLRSLQDDEIEFKLMYEGELDLATPCRLLYPNGVSIHAGFAAHAVTLPTDIEDNYCEVISVFALTDYHESHVISCVFGYRVWI